VVRRLLGHRRELAVDLGGDLVGGVARDAVTAT